MSIVNSWRAHLIAEEGDQGKMEEEALYYVDDIFVETDDDGVKVVHLDNWEVTED